jgi:cytidylate kinase
VERIGWRVSAEFSRRFSVPVPEAVQARVLSSLVIAIDGPSGSGKSSVSREVASRLDLEYLDTGAMYRAACWACLEAGLDLGDDDAVAQLVRSMQLVLDTDPRSPRVWIDGHDVTAQIRETRISEAVSVVAANQQVRSELRAQQRSLIARAVRGSHRGCVAEGRDMTTEVAPDANVRLLLTASERARLARRALQVHGSDDEASLVATRDQVLRRDTDDSVVTSFTTAADGVVELDSSGMSFEETVTTVLGVVVRQAEPRDVPSSPAELEFSSEMMPRVDLLPETNVSGGMLVADASRVPQ